MKTNKEVLNIALRHVGQGGAKFRKFCGLPSNAAWCNAFVDYVANEGGVKPLYFNGKKETYCPHSIKWCQANLAQIPPFLAMPMDVIYFDWEKNGVPNHIGFVRQRNTTASIYTLEGNTDGGKVAKKTRNVKYVQAIFRPHYKTAVKLATLAIDGQFDYNDIANLQRALKKLGAYTGPVEGVLGKNTVKGLQKVAKTTADGAWGANTSKAVQKLVGVKQDGQFGAESVKALQRWINKQNGAEIKPETKPTPAVPKKTKAEKLTEKAKELAWPVGTAKKKYAYKTGAPTAKMKTALKKRGYDSKVEWSDCGYNINTVVYAALGITTKVLGSTKTSFPKVSGFDVVYSGKKIVKGVLKPGDIIRYKKKSGSQHVVIYIGDNNLAEGGRKIRFFVAKHFPYLSKAKFNKANVKKSTLQVLRAKE